MPKALYSAGAPGTACDQAVHALVAPGKPSRRLHAREAFIPSLESTHGPRVTTRERSKRGSDAGAIDVRTRAVRFDLVRELECPANYGVPKSGRPRFFCHGSVLFHDRFDLPAILTRVLI